MSPEQWRERVAHQMIEPWGDEWEQTATIAQAVVSFANAVIELGTKKPVRSWPRPWDFIPWPKWKKKRLERERVKHEAERAAKKTWP